MKNNIAVSIMTCAMVFSLAFAGVAPQTAQAQTQTRAQLEAQIAQLTALLNTLLAQFGQGVSVSSTACPYTWTRNLGQGTTGVDVMRLQQFLNSMPDTRVSVSGAGAPGLETQYYGPATAAAVVKFQNKYRADVLTPLGLSVGTGYFGPSSRTKVNALCVAAPIVTTPTGDDDVNDDANDDATDDEVTLRGEGTLDTFEIDDASDDEIAEGSHDEPIAEITLEADDGDIRITRMDIALVGVNTPTESDPWDVFADVSLYINGEEVARKSADDEDGYLDEDDGTLRFSRLDIVLREGDEVDMTIAASVQNSVDGAGTDADWSISVESIRYFDADGVSSDDDSTGDIGDSANFSIVEEGEDDELRVRSSADDPDATTLELEDNTRSDFMTVFAFDLDTDDSTNDIEIRQIRVTVDATEDGSTPTSTANLINDARLMIDGDRYDDVTITHGTTGVFIFDIDRTDLVIDAGDRVTVKFQLEFDALEIQFEGATIEASTNASVGYEAEGADDLSGSQLQGAASGDQHTLRTEGLIMERISESFMKDTNSNTTVADDEGVFTLRFDVTAFENDIYLNRTAARGTTSTDVGAEYLITSGGDIVTTGTVSQSLTSTAPIQNGDYRVSEGKTETFTLKVTYDPATAGFYAVKLNNINFTTTPGGASFQAQRALPESRFETDEHKI